MGPCRASPVVLSPGLGSSTKLELGHCVEVLLLLPCDGYNSK